MRDHVKYLKRGPKAWNLWRDEHQLDFIDAFSNEDLRGADLSEADLSYLIFDAANLSEANLSKASLLGSNLEFVNLQNASLHEAYLEGANLHGAHCEKTVFRKAKLYEANLSGTYLVKADLSEASLTSANLFRANLTRANLNKADLARANLESANLKMADLRGANLEGADLSNADLSGANLYGANVSNTRLIRTDLSNAILTDCTIFGISAWGLKIDGLEQKNLIVTPRDEPIITVDNLEIAQFIYLLLTNERIRDVIDTITSKVVLILGRFSPDRKVVLDAIREELRKRNYLPILFDFEKPASRNLTETISTLAHMSRFIIADITDPKSIPQEFQRIIPDLPSVPIQPLLQTSNEEWGMFESFRDYDWVLDIFRYEHLDDIANSLTSRIIAPAERKAKKIEKRRREFERKTLKERTPENKSQ